MRLATYRSAGNQVPRRVPGAGHALQVDAKALANSARTSQASGLRQRHWSSGAWGSKRWHRPCRPLAASMECILACMALRDTTSNRPRPKPLWLVATTTCHPAWFEFGNGFQRAGQRAPFVRRLHELRTVFVDGAVAVENAEFHGKASGQAASLDRSATRFMATCRLLSKPKTVQAQVHLLGVDHHIFKEGVHRRAQGGQRLQRMRQ